MRGEVKPTKLKMAFMACRRSFIFVGVFSFLINFLMLTIPIYMMQIFDRVLAARSYDTLIFLTIIAILALLVLALLDIARSKILIRVSHWLDNSLSPYALSRSADTLLQGSGYGRQSLRDIATLRTFLSGTGIFSLFDAPWAPVYLLVIFMLHSVLGFISLFGAAVLFGLALYNELSTRVPLGIANAQNMKTQQRIDSTLNNAEAIQAMGMLNNIVRKWFNENEIVLRLQSMASDRSAMLLSSAKFFRMVLQLTVLGAGAMLVIQDQLSAGGMIAASILMARALAPVEQAIGTWKQYLGARQAYHRLKDYMGRDDIRGDTISLPAPTGRVMVENVTYVPPGSNVPIIRQVNFELKPGEIMVIIGPSGAGKSTLARIMLGIFKANYGCVRLDGADVFSWDRTEFGKFVGYLPQDVDLFTGTVRENIARMGEGSDAAVIDAAKLSSAHDMILHLPGGYESMIDGFSLSGGQRQRIALARAFYGNPKFVVLDEPNSSLDDAGDQALLESLKEARKRKITTVLITHRPSVIQYADTILVMNQGRIQLIGPRDEVIGQLRNAAQKGKGGGQPPTVGGAAHGGR